MALFDPSMLAQGDGGLFSRQFPGQYNYQGSPDDIQKYLGWPQYAPRYDSTPPMYSEPSGDPSGSQPLNGSAFNPYSHNSPVQFSTVSDAGGYAPKQDAAQWPQPGSPIAALMNGGQAQAGPPQAPQAPAFGAGAQPFQQFGNLMPPLVGPSAPQPAPQVAQNTPQAAPHGGPASMGSYGGVQYPIFGQPDSAALPPNAQPAGPAQAQQQVAPQQQAPQNSPGMFDRLTAGATNFTTGGNPLAGIMNALGGLATGQRTDPQGRAMQSQQATVEALVRSGVPAPLAQAAALNPKVLETIAPEYFGGFKVVQTGESPLGKQYMLQGPGGKFYPIGGEGGPGSTAGGGAPAAGPGLLAQGVKQYDANLSGEDYLKQFGPEVQASVKAYMNGDVMPTGNPRQQGIASFAKTVAQKYGQDIGAPVTDATYGAKRKMQVDLASSGSSSIGGILSNGKSAFGHLANASDKLVDLGSYNGPDVLLGGAAATATNWAGSKAGTSQTYGKITAAQNNLLKYGQEATKFYAGTGGGAEERMSALKTLNPQSSTGNEQAAFLETEKQLMLERIHQKEAHAVGVVGEKYLEDHPIRTPDLQKSIEKIDANIAKLRGDASPSTPSAAPAPPKIDAVQGGYRFRGGNPADKNNWQKVN